MAGTARSQSTDPFSMQRFHMVDTEGFLNLATPAAGFNTLSSPEMVLDLVEYQEGVDLYRKKFPGTITFTVLTVGKGMVKNDSSFYRWVLAGAENRPYRTDLVIKHYHRDDVTGMVNYLTAKATREIHCKNAWAARVKMGSDFDSLAADISVEEMDIEMES